jgi:hypothetical protein
MKPRWAVVGAGIVVFAGGVLAGVIATSDSGNDDAQRRPVTTEGREPRPRPTSDTGDDKPAPTTEPSDDEPSAPASTSPTSTPPPAPEAPGTSTFSVDGGTMTETFDGAPDAPAAWNPANWDITVHSRNESTWTNLQEMHAMHGSDCAGPPETHEVTDYADAVFQCRDHMMTAIKAGGYGAIYLTPAAMVDFTDGEAVIRVDVSTLRTSGRDWWDIWITPYEDNLQLPLQENLPDLNGVPRDGLRVMLKFTHNRFEATLISDGKETELDTASGASYDEVLTPDPARRDTFELRISRDHLAFGLRDYDLTWIDTDIPELSWSQGIVQFGHHSYNPEKAFSPENPLPNTWHWDNVTISPAVPFTIIKPDPPARVGARVEQVRFASPAPADSHLRFAGIGTGLEVSFDGGDTWAEADVQWASGGINEGHFRSYWMPVPEGTQDVRLRGDRWWGGDWWVRDPTIWAPRT